MKELRKSIERAVITELEINLIDKGYKILKETTKFYVGLQQKWLFRWIP
jgi:hypothetical protein